LVKEEGISFYQALVDATKDAELKEIHFTTAIALGRHHQGNRRTDNPEGGARKKGKWNDKQVRVETKNTQSAGKGKGQKKGGKGKGGGKGTNNPLLARTPDGKEICFAFNSEGCSNASCTRAHVCRKRGCLGSHSMAACPI
jgi:hypothetical protein